MANATATQKTRAVAANVMTQIAQIARSLGKESRKTLKDTQAAHATYVKADEKQKQAMRHVWVTEFMAAHLEIRNDVADQRRQAPRLGAKKPGKITVDGEEITLQPRDRQEQQAYDRARKMFSFHISRDTKAAERAQRKVRADGDIQDAITRLCRNVFQNGLTKEALETLIDQARLMASQMKASR